MRAVEVSARTVDEAIARALEQLGVQRDDVEVEVLHEGKPGGLFGLGGEDARVVVSISGNRAEPVRPPSGRTAGREPARQAIVGLPLDHDDEAEAAGIPISPATSQVLGMADEVVAELLRLMGVRATIDHYETPNALDPDGPIIQVLDIRGVDMGMLIGRRGETLESLQYMVNLIVSKRLNQKVSLEVDVEGYRRRRVDNLRGLATRMAERARQTGRSVALEPMSARERRIVHLALQHETDITTESSGEGEERKVVIYPRRPELPER